MNDLATKQIRRINFIEKEPFAFTYRKMLLIGVTLVSIVIFLSGIQWVRARILEKKIAVVTGEVVKLKEERERLAKKLMAESGPSTGGQAELLKIFDSSFSWPVILREITAQIPRSLWLLSLQPGAKPESGQRGVSLKGRAEEAVAIAAFVKALAGSPHFRNVVLTSSKQVVGTASVYYEFAIDLVAVMKDK